MREPYKLIRNEGTLPPMSSRILGEKKYGSLIPDKILVGLIKNEGTTSKVIRNDFGHLMHAKLGAGEPTWARG